MTNDVCTECGKPQPKGGGSCNSEICMTMRALEKAGAIEHVGYVMQDGLLQKQYRLAGRLGKLSESDAVEEMARLAHGEKEEETAMRTKDSEQAAAELWRLAQAHAFLRLRENVQQNWRWRRERHHRAVSRLGDKRTR